jgi:hypothetical protein
MIKSGSKDELGSYLRLTTAFESTEPTDIVDDLDRLLNFENEKDPEEFLNQSVLKNESGKFVVQLIPEISLSDKEGKDWNIDLSPAHIVGDGISYETVIKLETNQYYDFLKIRNRGPRSIKQAKIPTNTHLSIDSEICKYWANKIYSKGYYSIEDLEELISNCRGNGDFESLQRNIQNNLETAGLDPTKKFFSFRARLVGRQTTVLTDLGTTGSSILTVL